MNKKSIGKLLSLLLAFAMLMSVTNVLPAAAEEPTAIYTDWAFNDDYSKVTIDGKVYDNYVVLTAHHGVKELSMGSFWASYLLNPYMQKEYTPDEYFAKERDQFFKSIMTGVEAFYPVRELISVNGQPWQRYEYKDYFLDKFDMFYDVQFAGKITRERLWSILEDESCNGLAFGMVQQGLTKEQAAAKFDYRKYAVKAIEWDLVKTSEEFLSINGGQAYAPGNKGEFDSLAALERAMESDVPIVGTVVPQTVVTLFLNNPTMTVQKDGKSQSVTLEAVPFAPRGTTLVPIRAITEAFGGTVEWYGITKDVVITNGATTIKLRLGDKTAYVNDKPVVMLEAAQAINGRTVVPLRFISENIGYSVKWEGAISKITISN